MEQFDWKPTGSSLVPLYKQIEEYIKEKIINGEWTIGTKLPSQRAFSRAFEVNRSTIVMALDELAAQGLVEGKGRKGTIVRNDTWSVATLASPPNWNSYVETGVYYPNLPTIQEINQAEFYPNIIRLGTGELSPELLPEKKMKQIMKGFSHKKIPLGYEEARGDFKLREQIAKHLQKYDILTSPASILIVSGAIQALQLVSIGLLHKGSSILLEKPSYLYSLNVFQSAGMRLFGIPMDDQGIQPSLISKYKRQFNGSILYTIPSFHNPTSLVMNEQRRQEVMKVCNEIGLPIIEDAVYQDLWLDSSPPKPLKAYDTNGIVLHIGSMSKVISPGLRIGWIVGPETVIKRLADIKMQMDYGSSSLSQRAAAEWFASELYEQHIQQIRIELKKRRDFMIEMLEKYCGDVTTWKIPTGGFYIWLHIEPNIPIRELFEKALQEKILLNPGNVYDRNASQYLRLSYSYASMHDIEKGIRTIARLIKNFSV